MSATLDLLPAVELADCYRKTAAVWRESARAWRVTAERMAPALQFIALQNAEFDEQCAAADLARAESLEATHDVEALV